MYIHISLTDGVLRHKYSESSLKTVYLDICEGMQTVPFLDVVQVILFDVSRAFLLANARVESSHDSSWFVT